MKQKIKEGDKVLLLGKKNFLVRVRNENFQTEFGIIDLGSLMGKNYNSEVETHLGNKFFVVKPKFIDFLQKGLKRIPQIISLKDCSFIAGYVGVSPDWKILDAGSGSGFLALFFANLVPKGKVYTYEIRKDFYEVAKKNIENSGLKNIEIKNKDVREAKEKDLDLIILDLKNAEKVIPIVEKALKIGGFLVVYSPYIEQVKKVYKEMKNFSKKTFEVLVRDYNVGDFTRPKTKMIAHTGYITIGRKIQ